MLSIDNIDNVIDQFVEKKKHHNINELAPQHPFRLLAIGPSGAGKTNIIINLVLKYLYFDKLYLYVRDLQEDKYKFLIAFFEKLQKQYNEDNDTEDSIIEYSDNLSSLTIDQFDSELQNLVIFDDQITESKENQKIIDELFVRGRKSPNCSLIYQTQSYFDTPKLMRKQMNYLILLNVNNKRELKEIAKTYATSIDFHEFQKLYQECTNEPYGFMVIDYVTQKLPLKFRCKFDGLYYPHSNKSS